MGIDPTAAVERARSRSRSRVGRKRTRSVAGGEAMDVDDGGGDGAPAAKKRVHSSKSRYASRRCCARGHRCCQGARQDYG